MILFGKLGMPHIAGGGSVWIVKSRPPTPDLAIWLEQTHVKWKVLGESVSRRWPLIGPYKTRQGGDQ